MPPVCSDEGKVSQILRNFISNALKYTERGEVRVSGALGAAGDASFPSPTPASASPNGPRPHLRRVRPDREPAPAPRQGHGPRPAALQTLAELIGGTISVSSATRRGVDVLLTVPLMPADPGSCLPPDSSRVSRCWWSMTTMRICWGVRAGARRHPFLPHCGAHDGDCGLACPGVACSPPPSSWASRHRGELSGDLLSELRQHPLTMHVPVIVIAAAPDARRRFRSAPT